MTCRHSSCSRATWFQARYFEAMANILLISDATVVLDELLAVVDDGENQIVSLRNADRLRSTVDELQPDLVITDCQVQSMGGIAICLDLKLEESGGRLPHVPVLILLDRRADVFLAKTSDLEPRGTSSSPSTRSGSASPSRRCSAAGSTTMSPTSPSPYSTAPCSSIHQPVENASAPNHMRTRPRARTLENIDSMKLPFFGANREHEAPGTTGAIRAGTPDQPRSCLTSRRDGEGGHDASR